MWIRIVRMCLLLLNVMALSQAGLYGVGMFLIANIFCDSGPQGRCAQIGLVFFYEGAALAACILPAIVAPVSTWARIAWNLKIYPLLLVLLIVVAIRWLNDFPVLSTYVPIMGGLIAVLTCVYLFLLRPSKLQPDT